MKKGKFNAKLIDSSTVALISSILILIGLIFFSYNYIMTKKINAYSYMTIVLNDNLSQPEVAEDEPVQEEKEETIDENIGIDDYIGYLSIEKIGLNKGFLRKESTHNDVEENIYLVNEADYPFVKNGNLIIAAHSGTGWKAFFNDLYQLEVGDLAKIDFNNKIYTYKIDNIYKQSKTGTLSIYRNNKKNTLTLITCTNFDSTTQTVYIAYLVDTSDKV